MEHSVPAVSVKRLTLTPSGNIRYQLKAPYSDGTTHVIFEPLDFIAKLAALVPKPRVNLTRFHGVFAPNSKHRVDVTPAKRGKGCARKENEDKTPEQRHQAMTWAQRLKRVFNIDVSVCPKCGGDSRVIACIEDQAVIDKILAHFMKKGALPPPTRVAAGNAGLTRYWLVCMSFGFHNSLHGIATEEKVAWRPVA